MNILGIESSCDETAVAIVNEKREICSHIIRSQIDMHQNFGGVVPEVAAREHVQHIDKLILACLEKAQLSLSDIDAIAATSGPGLMGGLLVGTTIAKAISFTRNIPYIAINHLEGHALTIRLTQNIPFPYIMFLASGGHCQLLIVHHVGHYEILGNTIDDAIGETFDKVAKMLDLPYPGGPIVEKMAQKGDPHFFAFPRPLKGRKNCDFSFSGLKTAVLYTLRKIPCPSLEDKYNICASFQMAVSDIINDRLSNALSDLQERGYNPKEKNFVVAGGVAANQFLHQKIITTTDKFNYQFHAPPLDLCTDNGAMIAWAGLENFRLGYHHSLDTPPRPKWPLYEMHTQTQNKGT